MRSVDVGVLLAPSVKFSFEGAFRCEKRLIISADEYSISIVGESLCWEGELYERLTFVPEECDACFVLYDVLIGVNFHWERNQNQKFQGELIFFVEDGKVRAVNRIPVEDYLKSVISSEMSSASSPEFLKAHTVISRSWLYAQLMRSNAESKAVLGKTDTDETIHWYARENHELFDLCADDHCQRYQGIPEAGRKQVEDAVLQTSGLVLAYDGKVCDARFSKCCGGMTERFSACWEDEDMEYLEAFRDNAGKNGFVDLTNEENARVWIETTPDAFCNTADKDVLQQVLNGYDCETNDFYRWVVRYKQDELSQLVMQRSGIDFGTIEELLPVERAASGRLVRLRIVGSKTSHTVGKELEIRRWLSTSHLYSSAFVVDKVVSQDGSVEFVLKGAGWGHGVGLCQIGAAMMGEQGYNFLQILQHYYPGASVDHINNLL